MDMSTCSLIASERLIDSDYRGSLNGKKILVLGADHTLVMLDLPSLSNRVRISPPDSAGPSGVWSYQGMSWTSDNQPIVLWQSDTCLKLAVYTAHDASLVSLHEISRNKLPVSAFTAPVCMAVAPQQPYVAVTYAKMMDLHCGHAASVLSLKTGQVHRLAEVTEIQDIPVACDWAPSGLALVLRYQVGAKAVSNVWPAASAAFIAPEPMPDLDHAWSPNGEVCVLTRCSSIVMVLHSTEAGIEVWEAPLGELISPPRALGDRGCMAGQPAHSCSFTISPCSRVGIASGCIGPVCIKQWRFMLQQGRCERVHLGPGPGEQPELERPRIRWCPGAQQACVCAIQAGPCTIHIRHCAKADTLASVPMPAGSGFVQELLWAPDGMQLGYCMYLDGLQHLMFLNFHS